MAMQVDKVADMVVNMEADKGTDKLADMVVLMVENMEVDEVSNEVPNEVAHMVVDMEDRPGLPGLAYLRCLFDFFLPSLYLYSAKADVRYLVLLNHLYLFCILFSSVLQKYTRQRQMCDSLAYWITQVAASCLGTDLYQSRRHLEVQRSKASCSAKH